MTPKSLFTVLLKFFGVYFITQIVVAVPQLISQLYFSTGFYSSVAVFFYTVFALGIYGAMAWLLIFRTDHIIEKLKLDKGFEEEHFSLNMHRSSVMSIAVIVIGGLAVINALPSVLSLVYNYIRSQVSLLNLHTTEIVEVIFVGTQLLIGLLLLIKHRAVVNFIELRRRR